MRKTIVLAILLSCCVCAFARSKGAKQSTPSTGITIIGDFYFLIQGDGISTELKFNPKRIPQGNFAPLPHMTLVGVLNGTGFCQPVGGQTFFTASVVGQQLVVDFSTAPTSGEEWVCYAVLLFQPE